MPPRFLRDSAKRRPSRTATNNLFPNGTYYVRVVAGDPSYFGNRLAIAAEDVMIVSGTTTSAQRWLDGTAMVTVSDGRLTISNAAGADSNKICFVEITLRSVF